MLAPVNRPQDTANLDVNSSPTMARCSAAKATSNPQTNFMVCACPERRFFKLIARSESDGSFQHLALKKQR